MIPKNVQKVDLPISDWEECGAEEDPKGRLMSTTEINGCPMHVEAFAVYINRDREQKARVYDDAFESLCAGFSIDGAYRTVRIGRRNYAIFASPFC